MNAKFYPIFKEKCPNVDIIEVQILKSRQGEIVIYYSRDKVSDDELEKLKSLNKQLKDAKPLDSIVL